MTHKNFYGTVYINTNKIANILPNIEKFAVIVKQVKKVVIGILYQ